MEQYAIGILHQTPNSKVNDLHFKVIEWGGGGTV